MVIIPLWISLLIAIIAGVFAAVVAPIVTDLLNRRRWQKQKTRELKYDVFRSAVGALASWETDALDMRLQSDKATMNGSQRVVELRPTTSQALSHYHGLIAAFFSPDVAAKYDLVLKSHISLDNIPNTDFEEKRSAFIREASRELGMLDP